jgi:hypothetical protein
MKTNLFISIFFSTVLFLIQKKSVFLTNMLQPTQYTVNSSLTNSVHQVVKTYYQTLYDYQFHLSIFWLHFYTRHSCEQRNWACPAVQNKQENRLGSIYAAVISQTVFISAEKNTPVQIESSRSLYSVVTLLEFLNQWRPTFHDPYPKKNIYICLDIYIYIYIYLFILGSESIVFYIIFGTEQKYVWENVM